MFEISSCEVGHVNNPDSKLLQSKQIPFTAM